MKVGADRREPQVGLEVVERVLVGGAELAVGRQGSGPPLLFLHGEDGLLFAGPFLERLASHFSVIAPSHPGWDASPRPPHVRSIDDISYLYLDLLDTTGSPVVLVGASIGGWLAAEMATKTEEGLAGLVLVAPLGVKHGGRLDRTFVDIYATPPDVVRASLYGDPGRAPDLSQLDEDDFLRLAVAQEAVTRYGWEPYLHNPQLAHRLARIRRPTLVVAGAADRFVLAPGYYQHYAGLIGANAELSVIDGTGHRVEEERPDELARIVLGFVEQRVAGALASPAGR
jgi:pimeloyl-ACP methyl ester carboxylesterase